VNEQNRQDGLPEIEMGIGVHTGQVVVGNIGSSERTKYGVVGSQVNLTSRIQSCTPPITSWPERTDMGHTFGSIDDLGDGYGFRKVRSALGVTAFGVNAIVYPPGYEGFHHFHDTQDELYFVHAGQARVEVDGEARTLAAGGLVHVDSTTPRRVSNASESEDLVLLVIGGKGGYVERDGHMVDEADIARRAAFGGESKA
jgi:mannose-6-phosphate isomerase-like protein (cupin superfamily)